MAHISNAENFSELKYKILETACKALVATYIPSLIKCLEKLMLKSQAEKLAAHCGLLPMNSPRG